MKLKPLVILFAALILFSSIPFTAFGVGNIGVISDEEDDETITELITDEADEEAIEKNELASEAENTTKGSVYLGTFNIKSEKSAQSSENSSEESGTEAVSVASAEDSGAHEHSYKIIEFSAEEGSAVIRCTVCGNTYNDVFVDHLFNDTHQTLQTSDEPWDVVQDGTINGKDYAWLFKHFFGYYDFLSDFLKSKEFLYKEQFMFIYITVLFLISTGAICFTVRRSKK